MSLPNIRIKSTGEVYELVGSECVDCERLRAEMAALRGALYELDGGDDVTIVGDLKALLDDTARAATEHSAMERVEAFMRDNHFTKAAFSSRLGLSTLNIELESEPPPRTPEEP